VVSTTVLLLPEFLPDLVEDDAVVFSFNDLQRIVRTPRPRTLLATGWVGHLGITNVSGNLCDGVSEPRHTMCQGTPPGTTFRRSLEEHDIHTFQNRYP
jgi:hypothetical protein